MSEISKRLSKRQRQYNEEWKNIEDSTKKELKRLERFTQSCINELKKETRKDIRSLRRRRILAPILFSIMLLLSGIAIGVTTTLVLQGKTLATNHPADPSLILCDQVGEFESLPSCKPAK